MRLPDERHTKSRTRSRSRSPHHDRRANRSESILESRVGNRTSEDAETSEQPEWAKSMKTIVAMQQKNSERPQFLTTELLKANKRKGIKRTLNLSASFLNAGTKSSLNLTSIFTTN